ncbi:MAG: alpha/beta fold hydrolase [Rickettsiales bacterium]
MPPSYHATQSGHRIAYHHRAGEGVGVVFLCGFRSDMDSTKATALDAFCVTENIPYTRFDYFGHGKSDGEFIDYTIGRGLEDTLEILDHIAAREVILVGSSMGGWIGLHAALQRKGQVRGLVGVAAAPDFTERMLERGSPEQRREIMEEGVTWVYSDYSASDYPITKNLIENGRALLLLDNPIPLDVPVHLLQGQEDADVHWELALTLGDRIVGDDVAITLIKDGDHRLNRPADLTLLMDAVGRMRQPI